MVPGNDVTANNENRRCGWRIGMWFNMGFRILVKTYIFFLVDDVIYNDA